MGFPGRSRTDFRDLQRRLMRRLAALQRRVSLHLLLAGLATTAAAAAALALGSFFLDRWLRFSTGLRVLLLAIAALGLLRLIWRSALHPLRGLGPIELARALDAASAAGGMDRPPL